ncbi:helix-turn-helix domain-containing protein [Citricoccus alkalitolerans]|uniref:TetR/AcrR family transcriptional regulator n=1 Tax=Citricoccus alkalitolerans TaxID=246603 RepID=A0ABV8XV18_9MICC
MTLSPAALRICRIAVEQLAERGYDGASLGDIAQAAGMRKASLYSHFKSKDDLVGRVLSIALEQERSFATDAFAADTASLPGEKYLARIGERFIASAELRFLLRTAYAPPVAIRDHIIATYATFNDHIRTLFASNLGAGFSAETREVLMEGYLGIVDAVQVELLYGPTRLLERRRAALWTLLTSFATSRGN